MLQIGGPRLAFPSRVRNPPVSVRYDRGPKSGTTHVSLPGFGQTATEIRATGAAFCYHMGAVAGGFVPPILTYPAVERGMGFAVPMLFGTVDGLISFVITLFFSPETKGQVLVSDPRIVVPGE